MTLLLEKTARAEKKPTRYRLAWEAFPFSTLGHVMSVVSAKNDAQPIFFLGTQSGGLTLLSRMLKRHSQTVYCSGNRSFWAGRDEMQNLASERLPPSLQITPRDEISADADGAVLQALSNSLYASDPLVSLYRVRSPDVSSSDVEQLRRLVSGYVRTYGFFKREPRFVDKSQSFILRIPLIRQAFPEARFVLVTRNPWATALSRSFGRGMSRLDRASKRSGQVVNPERLLTLQAQHWRNSLQIGLEELKGVEYLQMRFEDFLKSPEDGLRHLLEFCRLNQEPDLLPAAHHTLPPGSISGDKWFPMDLEPNAKYLDKISRSHRDLITSTVGAFPSTFGYSPPPA